MVMRLEKTVSSLPETLAANALYFVRTGEGFDFFISDETGTAAHPLNASIMNNPIPSGTRMLMVQSTAPTGWTRDTTHDDKALRVVSGTAGSGGTRGFSTVLGTDGYATEDHVLTEAQIPSHGHLAKAAFGDGNSADSQGWPADNNHESHRSTDRSGINRLGLGSSLAGGDQGHSHDLDFDIAYVDTIICVKD